jgi:hypothetical protein
MATRDVEKVAEEEHAHFQNVVIAFQRYAPYTVGALKVVDASSSPNT